MLDNYAVMADLRYTSGFIWVDRWSSTNENRMVMERETRWVRISLIHGVLSVAGVQAGPDESEYRLSSRGAGVGAR